jgi:RND family efflux transporter MFP subunit
MIAWQRAGWLGWLLGALVPAAGCGPTAAEPAATAESARKAVPVTVAPLQRRTVERTVDVIGTLRGWEQVTVGTKRTGRVVKVDHDLGDRVEPGVPLVELDPIDPKLEIDQAESKYLGALVKLGITKQQAEEFVRTYGISEDLLSNKLASEAIAKVPSVVEKRVARERAEQRLRRQQALTQRRAGTAQELEDAESEFRTAVAGYENAVHTARTVIADAVAARVALAQAEHKLEDMTIRAPWPKLLPPGMTRTGRLSYGLIRRQVSEGQMIKEGEAVAELVIEDPLRLRCQVPEQYAAAVQVGQLVRLAVRAHPQTYFAGKVARISPSVDPTSRTFPVEAIVPNTRGLLRPGGFARASIITESQAKAAVVPVESIVRFAGVTKLFIVEHGKARAIDDIKTGKEGRGWIEVMSRQLPPSAEVVTTGQSQLADQTPVSIRRPEPAASRG